MADEILTESGTNEVEFLEFYIGSQSFAVNVAKVVQIIPYDNKKVTPTAMTPDAVLGSLLWRDRTIDLFDMQAALHRKEERNTERPIILVTNFNNVTSGFYIDGVERIHRLSWDEIRPMDAIMDSHSPRFTGVITIGNKNVLLVDFEKILAELCPDLDETGSEAGLKRIAKKTDREDNRIVFAEDSGLIRRNMTRFLREAGYHVTEFENGALALDYVTKKKKEAAENGEEITKYIDLVITDIEMPRMDGLTLCRRIKKDLKLGDLPVLIFSSLINEQMAVKCKEVGADAYVSKPRSEKLINQVDEMLLA